MEIIPVIDLKRGTVVHARMGCRERYRPIETPLARTSDPLDVLTGLLSIHPFRTLYIADLDAIAGTGDNDLSLRTLKQAQPQITFWVDNGIADVASAADWLEQGAGHLVLGSETQTDVTVVEQLSADWRVVLSLDFRSGALQGPPALWARTDLWPRRVIVMTLDRVGSDAGPDFERVRAVRSAAAGRALYAAGGIRDATDLAALAADGVAGALVASSLHNGRITAVDLARLS
jgi:phosphoribosylformimino-5-aminoimidazole carboxamide ribotide isomerase